MGCFFFCWLTLPTVLDSHTSMLALCRDVCVRVISPDKLPECHRMSVGEQPSLPRFFRPIPQIHLRLRDHGSQQRVYNAYKICTANLNNSLASRPATPATDAPRLTDSNQRWHCACRLESPSLADAKHEESPASVIELQPLTNTGIHEHHGNS